MDAGANKQIVMDGFRQFESGEIAPLLERFHDDATWISPEMESVPFSGCFHGRQGVAQFFTKLAATVEPLRFVAKDFIAEGDKVVVVGEATWRVRSTGLSYDSPWVNVFTLRDGKIIRTDAYYDTAPAAKACCAVQTGQAAPSGLRH